MALTVASFRRRCGSGSGGGRGAPCADAIVVTVAALWACLATTTAAAADASTTQCEAGWKYLLLSDAAPRCYGLSQTADTRYNASAACRGRGAELLAVRTRANLTSALALFAAVGSTPSSVVSLLDYAVYANGTVVDRNGALVADCLACANISLAPGRVQPACLLAGLAVGGAGVGGAAASAFVQDVDCSERHTYLCSKPPTSGASNVEVQDAMAIFCTVFILVNFLFFNGYFLLSDYLKHHPHDIQSAPKATDPSSTFADNEMLDITKTEASEEIEKWLSEQGVSRMPQTQPEQQHTPAQSTAALQPLPKSASGEISADSVTAAPTAMSSDCLVPGDEMPNAVAGSTEDYADTLLDDLEAVAAKAARRAALALDRVTTPRYPQPYIGSNDSGSAGLSSPGGSAAVPVLAVTSESSDMNDRPSSVLRVTDSADKANDRGQSSTSRRSRPLDVSGSFDGPTMVSVEEAGLQQRSIASDMLGRALSASAQPRQPQALQPAELSRTISRSAAHLR